MVAIAIFSSFAFVSFAYAKPPDQTTGGLVPCGGTDQKGCDFGYLIQLIQNVITFLIFLGATVSAGLFAYAGFQYILAAGDPGKITKAHSMFTTAFLGLVFMASAWLIVKVIVVTLESDSGAQFLGGIKS